MTREVDLTRRARRDVEEIYEWIAERSRDGANRWYAAFLQALEGLAANPEGKGLAPESREFDQEVRQAFFRTRKGRTYRAVFIIEGAQIHALAVRGPGQRLLRPEELSDSLD
jgi:plasmid stabilization system protein ParE